MQLIDIVVWQGGGCSVQAQHSSHLSSMHYIKHDIRALNLLILS